MTPETPSHSPGTTDLAQRYGAPTAMRRRTVTAVAVLVAVAFLGWLAWTTWAHATPVVTSELETFAIDGDDAATAVLVITLRDGETEASCRIRALAEDHNVVGELTFRPDPGAGRRQSYTIRTERRATTVERIGCTAPGQSRPR